MVLVFGVLTTGAWGMDFVSSSPFSLLPPCFKIFIIIPFFKIFIIIRFSSFDNISRRHTSWIIRVFCVHSFSTDTVWTLLYCIGTNDYWNFEKWMIMKILKKGGSREKGGEGNEIDAPCACGFNANFSNISTISWRPVLVENHRPWASNW